MSIFRKRTFCAVFAALAITASLVVLFCSFRGHSYAGKPLSFWCDQLPITDQLPVALGGNFHRMYRSSTNQAEQARLGAMEKQALLAIDTLGTNCLPQLLRRLCKEHSPLQFESRKLAAKLGFIKQTEVGIWHVRRMQALTGVIELGDRARSIVPELTALKGDADTWLSAATSYALKKIAPQEAKS